MIEKDQNQENWTIFEPVKSRPKLKPNSDLPPIVFSFLGQALRGQAVLKPKYAPIVCKACGRFSDDDVFDVGFSDPVSIKLKGDFGHTNDRVFAISSKFHEVLQHAKVGGYETKPIGKSGWHALRVTERVACDETVMEERGPFCDGCKRPDRVIGRFRSANQIALPSKSNTFFTTKRAWAKPFYEREIFLTEDVLAVLKAGGIKGGWCNRLFNEAEAAKAKEAAKKGTNWEPPSKSWVISL